MPEPRTLVEREVAVTTEDGVMRTFVAHPAGLERAPAVVMYMDAVGYREELRQSGHYITSSPLQPVDMAMTVRVRNGQVSITDGPFAETKEQLGGFYLIEARDLNEAIRLAARMPPARLGSIEVRPLKDFDQC